MEITQNKAISSRFIDEVFNNGAFEAADDLLAESFVAHVSGTDQSRSGLKDLARAYRNGFPDYHCTIDDQIAEGDQVVTRWTFTGTQTGQLFDIPPTGRPVTVTGIAIDRITDGALVESWLEVDVNRMLQALGLLEPVH